MNQHIRDLFTDIPYTQAKARQQTCLSAGETRC